MKSFRLNLSLTIAFAAFAAGALAAPLAPGSKAPKLEVKEWLKGNPIQELSPTGVYVFEFWSTRCGPCIEAMPHLSELARKYPEAQFLGVGVYESNADKRFQKFMVEKGDTMDYRVLYSGNEDGMYSSWLNAAGVQGIPATFIVSKGVIQWIGHPLNLEEPLKATLAGTIDTATEKKKHLQALADNKQKGRVRGEFFRIGNLYDSGNVKEAKAALAKFAKWPGSEEEVATLRFYWQGLENPPTKEWKEDLKRRLYEPDADVSSIAYLSKQLVGSNPRLALWIHRRVQERMNGESYSSIDSIAAEVMFAVKKYDVSLKFARSAHADFIKWNPVLKGTELETPYLDLIRMAEEAIKKLGEKEKPHASNPNHSIQQRELTP